MRFEPRPERFWNGEIPLPAWGIKDVLIPQRGQFGEVPWTEIDRDFPVQMQRVIDIMTEFQHFNRLQIVEQYPGEDRLVHENDIAVILLVEGLEFWSVEKF